MAQLKIGLITCTDTRNEESDTAGAALRQLSEERGWLVIAYRLCVDERRSISLLLQELADVEGCDVIFTCGGTGFSPRDVTPEATLDVADREAPGIAEYIRAESAKVTKRAMLSRAVAALRGTTVIINLPGSEKAARESFSFIADQLEHAVEMMAGGGH